MANIMTSDYDHIFKLLVIGDSGVGKSCLLARYADECFYDGGSLPTIGVDFKFRTITLEDKVIKLQIWDTAGQERFRTIVASYYRGAHGIMLAYDTTNTSSFDNLGYWVQEIKRFAPPSCPLLLVGTKTDLKSLRTVSEDRVREFAAQYCGGVDAVVETSAKSGNGVDRSFEQLARQVFKQRALKLDTSKPEVLILPEPVSSEYPPPCC